MDCFRYLCCFREENAERISQDKDIVLQTLSEKYYPCTGLNIRIEKGEVTGFNCLSNQGVCGGCSGSCTKILEQHIEEVIINNDHYNLNSEFIESIK